MRKTTSRVGRAALSVATALLMAAGLGVAPAAATTPSPYGEVLNTQSTSVPGGVLTVTEYENVTEVVGTIASCDVIGSASKPTLRSGRLSSSVKWNVQGCTSKVKLTHIIAEKSAGTPLELARWDGTKTAPTHVVHLLSRSCTRGSIISVLTISLGTFDFSYYESPALKVTKC
jgi:hypothetical protein